MVSQTRLVLEPIKVIVISTRSPRLVRLADFHGSASLLFHKRSKIMTTKAQIQTALEKKKAELKATSNPADSARLANDINALTAALTEFGG